eukprot:TRINITY_DN5365_c0_g1_i1.p1 TRINITY_DN5365_c0_g1~~TRINITY_DN5365_c0_g1_i1.p1  ORF type:complete len:416 (+),score=97.54 TRINITY_DN5365_c0_g1_i1:156-1403(+)
MMSSSLRSPFSLRTLVAISFYLFFAVFAYHSIGYVRKVIYKETPLQLMDKWNERLKTQTVVGPNKYNVLYWTKKNGKSVAPMSKSCSRNCTLSVTSKRVSYNKADIVMLSAGEIDMHDLPHRTKGKRGNPHKRWFLYSEQSPAHHAEMRDLDFMKLFTGSMTYRLGSEAPIPHSQKYPGDALRDLITARPEFSPREKTDLVVWMEHDCASSNRRTEYVMELMHHLGVTSYGNCMNNREWPEEKSRMDIMRTAKFTLVFEDSSCKDYVTELYWDALVAGTVPIYMGAPNVEQLTPTNHAILNVADFRSPQELASFVQDVSSSDETYLSFLDYKYGKAPLSARFRHFLKMQHNTDPWCRLCHALQLNPRLKQKGIEVDGTCSNKQGILRAVGPVRTDAEQAEELAMALTAHSRYAKA